MKNHLLFAFCVLLALSTSAQTYTSYFTGSTADVSTTTQGGTVLMGGATEDDNAMIWFLQRAGGGDVVDSSGIGGGSKQPLRKQPNTQCRSSLDCRRRPIRLCIYLEKQPHERCH